MFMKKIEDLKIEEHWGSFDHYLSTYVGYCDEFLLKIKSKCRLDGYLTEDNSQIHLNIDTATQLRDKLSEFIRTAKKKQTKKAI